MSDKALEEGALIPCPFNSTMRITKGNNIAHEEQNPSVLSTPVPVVNVLL